MKSNMMLRLTFWYLFAVSMTVAFIDDELDDELDFQSGDIHLENEEILYDCPNDKCSDSEKFPFTYPVKCCKLMNISDGLKLMYPYNRNNHERGQLHKLIIEKSKIKRIPENVFTYYQPIVLRMVQGDLTVLKLNDFSGATRLKQINLSNNKIENIEPNLFIYAPNIEQIDLSNNRITQVSEYAFDNNPKLKILMLSNNLIQKFDFNTNLINLEILMIGNNSISNLNQNLLINSRRLSELCINNNKLNITKLNIYQVLEVFDMSENPQSIYLSSKIYRIKNSNTKVLHIDRKVETIDASENQINSIVVDPLSTVIDLNLSRNNLTTFQNFTALKSIQKLDLSFNQIHDFNLTSFSNMSDLQELNLENSGLKTIDFGMFSHQKNLNFLDISYNNLKEINFNMLTNSLQYLYIEGNALTNIDFTDIHITLPNLNTLGLSNNKFSCEKLVEIRKVLSVSNIQMYVDEDLMVKSSKNINGIGCVNENTTETIEFRSTNLLPIHTNGSAHNSVIETIEVKIKEIEKNIIQHNDSLMENSINSKYDILSMKQDIMNVQNDVDLKLINAKVDILMSVSSLLNVSINGSDVNIDLKSTIEEINKVNLERYQSLSTQLKLVKDKIENLAESFESLRDPENLRGNRDISYMINDDKKNFKDKSDDLISLKNMMTFITVTIILLILGSTLTLIYRRYAKGRRYVSTNTINTNVEQSLV